MKEGHVSMERKNDLEGSGVCCLMFSCIKGLLQVCQILIQGTMQIVVISDKYRT
jgi:hypothetical protein